MKRFLFLIIVVALLGLTACKPDVCLEDSVTYADDSFVFPQESELQKGGPEEVLIGKKTILFDRVVHGPVCNDTWQGKVFVACDITIKKWEETPNFLEGCELNVDPDAVVYVAAHNNAPYYKGCGECH